ncbi:MAG: DMT family transporter [Deltaproteobacteria bacterium]|nr:DMT family transporter [Deltaproteobacteria bacterium]
MSALPVGELAAVSAAVLWAIGSLLFARIGRDGVPAGAMNLGKLVVAGAALGATAFVRSGHVVPSGAPAHALWLLAASAIVGLTIGDTAYFGAILALGVPRAILLLSSAPVFAALGGFFWLGERLDARALVGMALVFAGIALVVLRPSKGGERGLARGVALGLVAGIGQASGSLLSRRAMQVGIDPLAAASGRILVGLVGVLALALITRDAAAWTRALLVRRTAVRISVAAMIGTYCGIWLAQTALLHARSTGVAATLLATSPVFALPIAHLLGQERMTARAAIGVLTAVAGIAALSLR